MVDGGWTDGQVCTGGWAGGGSGQLRLGAGREAESSSGRSREVLSAVLLAPDDCHSLPPPLLPAWLQPPPAPPLLQGRKEEMCSSEVYRVNTSSPQLSLFLNTSLEMKMRPRKRTHGVPCAACCSSEERLACGWPRGTGASLGSVRHTRHHVFCLRRVPTSFQMPERPRRCDKQR